MRANDYPFSEIVKAYGEQIAKGNTCFQKFTCAKCGNRLTIDDPNKLYTRGTCDNCGHETDIEKQGCNYMLMIPGRKT